ncbi:hypothetical protein M8C21_028520, partial [Ambrosia artemisiifolia]
MGRTKSWFSAIKKVFTSHSKDKLPNELERRSAHERKGRGRVKHGESRSFIPLFRQPSSIEKILEEVDQQLLYIGNPTSVERPTTPQPLSSGRPASPRLSSHRVTSPRLSSHRAASPRAASPISSPPRVVVQRRAETSYRPEPTLRQHHRSATIIQAAYRGYMARKSFRGLKGLVRLQGVVRGQHVKRQTVNAMKHMQLLVRVQTQIQSRRIQMLENQALGANKNDDKGGESSLGKWNFNNPEGEEHWDDSLISKEEREARLQRKMEAIIKRERAMAYAYSNQLWKATPKSAQNALTDIRTGQYPWWWNWLERQLPSDEPKNAQLTPIPPRPRSSRSTVPTTSRLATTPTRTPPSTTLNLTKHSKPKPGAVGSPYPMKDNDSMMSCPPFSVPNYMNPTVSAKAKARLTTNSRGQLTSSAASETSSTRRFSFPLTPTFGSSFKWNKRASSKETPRVLEKHKSTKSIGDLSMDSS